MLAVSHTPHVGHLVTSVEHKISPIGIAAIGLAVLALLAYCGPVGDQPQPAAQPRSSPRALPDDGSARDKRWEPAPPDYYAVATKGGHQGARAAASSPALGVGWRTCSSERAHVCASESSSRFGVLAA